MDIFRPSQGYQQLEHTADLAIEFWAPTQESLLLVGGLALVDILTGGEQADEAEERLVEIDAVDAEDRMVRFLNEVLVAATSDGFFVAGADIELRGEGGLRATLRGERAGREALATELKSVTYHDLSLTQHEYGWNARVIIDV